jgi:hypothetical protein
MHVHHFLNLIMHAHRVEVGFLSCHQILLIRTMASSTDCILFSSFLTSKNRTHLSLPWPHYAEHINSHRIDPNHGDI